MNLVWHQGGDGHLEIPPHPPLGVPEARGGLIHCSFFNRAADNTPRAWEGTWGQLLEELERSHVPRHGLAGDDAKKSLPAICGARFRAGSPRGRANALEVGLVFFDFDNAHEEPTGEFWIDPRTGTPTERPKVRKVMIPEPVGFEEVQEALWNAEVHSFTWTTWSHRPGWPRFRVVVPLAHPVPAKLWEPATEWALRRLGFAPFRRGLDLPVLRDVARLNFLPGAPCPAMIRRGETQGGPLAVPLGGLERAAVPSLPVAPWQRKIQAERKAARDAGLRWFQCYLVGGRPVDFMVLDLAGLLRGQGLKVGSPQAYGTGQKWRCHCPWAHEHSGGVDDDCAVVIQTPGQWPSFRCAHSHHAHLGLQDVVELVWGRP